MAKSDAPTSHGRRAFFKEAFVKLIQPVAEYLDEQIDGHLPPTLDRIPSEPGDKPILRPPGALPEGEFLITCQQCGNCIDSCPAEAIQPLQSNDLELAGTPYIDPDHQPCVVCNSLACMQVCPSGALQKLSVNEIRIGLAQVNDETCLRTKGIDCTYCIDRCPIGEKAIRLDSQRRVEVISAGCIGCGVCQHECPTTPKSIVVQHQAITGN